jgi:hypothetical protein
VNANVKNAGAVYRKDFVSSGDSWFMSAVSKYVECLGKELEAEREKDTEKRNGISMPFDTPKTRGCYACGRTEGCKRLRASDSGMRGCYACGRAEEYKRVRDSDSDMFGECEMCFRKSFKEYSAAEGTEADEAHLYKSWGNAAYALAVIMKRKCLYLEAKDLFEKAVKFYGRVGAESDAEVLRRMGNANYELAAIGMEGSAYNDAEEFFKKAVESYNKILYGDEGGGRHKRPVHRNCGNALFEMGRIAWREYLLVKENCDPAYHLSLVGEADGMPESFRGAGPVAGIGYAETVRDAGGAEPGGEDRDFGQAEKLFNDAVSQYEEVARMDGSDQGGWHNYVDVYRNWGELYSILGRKKRYDCLTMKRELKRLERLSAVASAPKDKIDPLLAKLEKALKEAVELFVKANEKFEEARRRDAFGREWEARIMIGATHFRLFLTHIMKGSGYGADVNEAWDKAEKAFEEAFEATGKDILDLLVYLETDVGYHLAYGKLLYKWLDKRGGKDAEFFKSAMKAACAEGAAAKAPEAGKEQNDNQLDKYKAAYLRSLFIVSRLEVGNRYESAVAHYTSQAVAKKLLLDAAEIRLNAANYGNDPEEGRVLLDWLFPAKAPGQAKETRRYEDTAGYMAFIGCFSFDYDGLNQFRLYGKTKKREGTGVSIVFNKTFFRDELEQDRAAFIREFETELTGYYGKTECGKVIRTMSEVDSTREKFSIFRCIYFDPKTDRVVTVGKKEKYLFFRENAEKADKDAKDYDSFVNDTIGIVNGELDKLKELVKDLNPKTVGILLLRLRYLVKDIAFAAEQECRILETRQIDDKNDRKGIVSEATGQNADGEYRLHLPYQQPVPQNVKEVVFGPEANGLELFRDNLIFRDLRYIDCRRSASHFAGDTGKE